MSRYCPSVQNQGRASVLSLETQLACCKASTLKEIHWFKILRVFLALERSTVLLVAWEQHSETKHMLRKAPWYEDCPHANYFPMEQFWICKESMTSAREARSHPVAAPRPHTRQNCR